MPKCIIAHEVPLGAGKFKVFEAGREYPTGETAGREMYFENLSAEAEYLPADDPEEVENDAIA